MEHQTEKKMHKEIKAEMMQGLYRVCDVGV